MILPDSNVDRSVEAPGPGASADPGWLRTPLVARWPEILLIVAILVGPFAWRSTRSAWQGSGSHYVDLLISNSRLLSTGAIESLLLALFLGFLHWRGWTTSDFKVHIGGLGSLAAIPLLVVTQIANTCIVLGLTLLQFAFQPPSVTLLSFLEASAPHLKAHSIEVSWLVVLGTMILNAFFEELICMGYAFNQFAAKLGPLAALLLTVMMRMACHTYQGPVHVLGVGALFLIYGLWYWYSRNLWTLILAHALLDLGSVGLVKELYG